MIWHTQMKALIGISAAVGGYATYKLTNNQQVHAASVINKPKIPWDWNWDKRELSTLVTKAELSDQNQDKENLQNITKSTATRHLIFIRHGQYNLEGSADSERYLTPLGQEQARYTGQRLKLLNKPITKLVYSSMTRASQTAQIIIDELIVDKDIVIKCDMLREGAPVPPEPSLKTWQPEDYKFYVDGARIESAFRKYFHRAPPSQTKTSYEVYVCHANVIRYFVCRALQLPPEAWLRFSLQNASITHLVIKPSGRVSLTALGDAGFMPPEKSSFN